MISFVIFSLCCIFNLIEGYSFVIPATANRFRRPIDRFSDKLTWSRMRQTCTLEMKITKSRSKDGKGSTLQTVNSLRTRYAGKPGSKNFLDPNKVFIGNLPFDATENHLSDFLTLHLGNLHNIDSFKIIRDWKTGKSKGFGFIQFTEPIYATSAIEMIKNKFLLGRVINLRQGMRKDDDEIATKRQLYVKIRSKGKYRLDEEGSIIDAALDEAEDIDDHSDDTEQHFSREEVEVIVEEDRVDDTQVMSAHDDAYSLQDFDDIDDSILFNSVGDDDEVLVDDGDEYDGDFEEIYGSSKFEDLPSNGIKTMNRQQRREAAKRRPRRKLPHKGFG